MSPEEIALKMLGLAVAVSPILEDFISKAIAHNPDHPLARRVEEILPSTSRSRAIADALTSSSSPPPTDPAPGE